MSLTLLLITVTAGLTIRFLPLGLPAFLVKYGGSALWALAIYWLVSSIFPTHRLVIAILLSGSLATAVEFFKLYHSPALDAFRRTVPGIALLGRYFSPWDLLAYWLAIAAGALLDQSLFRA